MSKPKPIEFLMVEDHPGDVRLTQEFFKDYKLANSMSIVADADATLSYLRREGVYSGAARPDIILCSFPLYQDSLDGVWGNIRHHACSRDIPIVLLTGFEGEEATLNDLSPISCCVTKPLDFGRMTEILHHVSDFGVVVTCLRGRPRRTRKTLPAPTG
ncbi:MAG: response regulator [Anaerolineae bacterium]|nr:response regulator [Anaerolineae bacterium]